MATVEISKDALSKIPAHLLNPKQQSCPDTFWKVCPGSALSFLKPYYKSTLTFQDGQKKEKSSPESKGISRFIPPWLKKQKSYTLAEAKDEPKKKATGEEQVVEESESQTPEGVAQSRKSLEEAAENRQNAKADDKHSVSSAEIQVRVGRLMDTLE